MQGPLVIDSAAADRVVDGSGHRGDRGLVEYPVDTPHAVIDGIEIADVGLDDLQLRVVCQVFSMAGGKIIQYNDIMSVLQQPVDNV